MSLLLNFGNQNYFIDFANVEKVLSSGNSGFKGGMVTETKTITSNYPDTSVGDKTHKHEKIIKNEYYKSKEVDGFRYETIRTMIEILLNSTEETNVSDNLSKQSISFKLAFNTLVEYGILNIAE